MSRRRLSDDSATVMRKYKIPEHIAIAFANQCSELERTQSDTIRTLIERWLRQTAAIARLKGKPT